MDLWNWLHQSIAKLLHHKRKTVTISSRHSSAFIREGFHRHDRAPEPCLLDSPKLGQQVKVQINLTQELECAAYPGESSQWLAMGGEVVEVLSSTKVKVSLAASTDRYPAAFEGCWIGTLNFHEELEYPWILTELEYDSESPN